MNGVLVQLNRAVAISSALFCLHVAAAQVNCEKSINSVSFEQSFYAALDELAVANPRTQKHLLFVWEQRARELHRLKKDWTATRIEGPGGLVASVGSLYHALIFHPDGRVERAYIYPEDYHYDGSWSGAYHIVAK